MAPNNEACAVCGKVEGTSKCSKCKSVSYCGAVCQKANWKLHKATCKLILENVACCDACQVSQDVGMLCFHCGTLYCNPCFEKEELCVCRGCSRPLHEACFLSIENRKALQALTDRQVLFPDKRRGFWCIILGELFQDDGPDSVGKDIEQAKKYYELAGTLGYGEGYSKLGNLYMKEDPTEWRRAKEYMEKAADLQYLNAIYNLGQHHYDGSFGGISDYVTAKKWYEKGAKLGDAGCCYQLGDMYNRGQGMPADKEKACTYFRRGAEKGHVNSQSSLGMRYRKGEGVPQSNVQARYWWEKAAVQGDACAAQNLRVLSRDGH